jgi:dihydrofolate reductase
MRKLIASTFTSLDGVMQAPGGPTEDPTGNFTLGWLVVRFRGRRDGLSASGFDGKDRELVLGRKTYEIFEAYWPYQSEDHRIARTLNAAKKHVPHRSLRREYAVYKLCAELSGYRQTDEVTDYREVISIHLND